MIWSFRQLLSPVRYLKIRQGESLFRSKAVYDWILPLLLAAITHFITIRFAGNIRIFSEEGIIGGFQKLMEILVPFYIAALAAVATFERKGLDDEMKGDPAYFWVTSSTGEVIAQVLTRRQFICYLFGYLAFSSLVLFVSILFCNILADNVGKMLRTSYLEYLFYLKTGLEFVFLFFIWQVIIITLLGVYFMSDRLTAMTDPNR